MPTSGDPTRGPKATRESASRDVGELAVRELRASGQLGGAPVARRELRLRRVMIAGGVIVAVALAAVGVVLYVTDGDVPGYYALGLLSLPLVLVVGTWLHRLLPRRVQLVGAAILAVAGIGGYLLWPGDAWWALGQAALAPALLLIAEGAGFLESGAPPLRMPGDDFSGPFGPP